RVVVGDAALQGDRLVLRPARALMARARVAALPVLDDLGCPLKRTDLADACDVGAVPLHPELEVLVGVETVRVHAELGHLSRPPTSAAGRPAAGSARRRTRLA